MTSSPWRGSAADLSAAIPRREVDPRLLAKALTPGRVRDIAVRTWAQVRQDPRRATGTLRQAMRLARALHSRERRFVSDALRDLCRMHRVLPDDPDQAWLAWCVHLGADADDAAAQGLADAGAWQDLPGRLHAAIQADPDAVAEVAGVPRAVWATLADGVGVDRVTDWLAASAERAPVDLRVDPRQDDRDAVVAALRSRDVDAVPTPYAPHGVRVAAGTHLASHRHATRHAELQDEASQLVAALVAARPGERVLDLCAGGGGKTLALGADLQGQGTLWATDVRGRALGELKKRAKRAGVKVRTALLRDDRPSCDLGPPFDAVLVDAPCTGSGVWRRHPEWRFRLDDLEGLNALQDRVLDLAAGWVRPGGRLIYATCSVLQAENADRVAAFARRHPDWQLVPARQQLPEVDAAVCDGPFLRTWPHEHGCDGFFGAVLLRL